MRECFTYGSVRGAAGNGRPYRDPRRDDDETLAHRQAGPEPYADRGNTLGVATPAGTCRPSIELPVARTTDSEQGHAGQMDRARKGTGSERYNDRRAVRADSVARCLSPFSAAELTATSDESWGSLPINEANKSRMSPLPLPHCQRAIAHCRAV